MTCSKKTGSHGTDQRKTALRHSLLLLFLSMSTGGCNATSSLFPIPREAKMSPDARSGDFQGCLTPARALDTTRIEIRFAMPAGATRMNLYRDGLLLFSTHDTQVQSFIDSDLQEGRTYTYNCEAIIEGKAKLGSQALRAETYSQALPTFNGLGSVEDLGNRSVRIRWSPASGAGLLARAYLVYANPAPGALAQPDWSRLPRAVVSMGEHQAILSGLADEIRYRFGVRACGRIPTSFDENSLRLAQCETNTVSAALALQDSGGPTYPSSSGFTLLGRNGNLVLRLPWSESVGGVRQLTAFVKVGSPDSAGVYSQIQSDYPDRIPADEISFSEGTPIQAGALYSAYMTAIDGEGRRYQSEVLTIRLNDSIPPIISTPVSTKDQSKVRKIWDLRWTVSGEAAGSTLQYEVRETFDRTALNPHTFPSASPVIRSGATTVTPDGSAQSFALDRLYGPANQSGFMNYAIRVTDEAGNSATTVHAVPFDNHFTFTAPSTLPVTPRELHSLQTQPNERLLVLTLEGLSEPGTAPWQNGCPANTPLPEVRVNGELCTGVRSYGKQALSCTAPSNLPIGRHRIQVTLADQNCSLAGGSSAVLNDALTIRSATSQEDCSAGLDASQLQGTGTQTTPFVICSVAQLDALRTHRAPSGTTWARIARHLDFSSVASWNPVRTHAVSGTTISAIRIDGQGFAIVDYGQAAPIHEGLFNYSGNSNPQQISLYENLKVLNGLLRLSGAQTWSPRGILVNNARSLSLRNILVTGRIDLTGYLPPSETARDQSFGLVAGDLELPEEASDRIQDITADGALTASPTNRPRLNETANQERRCGLVAGRLRGATGRNLKAVGSVESPARCNFSGGIIGVWAAPRVACTEVNGQAPAFCRLENLSAQIRNEVAGQNWVGGVVGQASSIGQASTASTAQTHTPTRIENVVVTGLTGAAKIVTGMEPTAVNASQAAGGVVGQLGATGDSTYSFPGIHQATVHVEIHSDYVSDRRDRNGIGGVIGSISAGYLSGIYANALDPDQTYQPAATASFTNVLLRQVAVRVAFPRSSQSPMQAREIGGLIGRHEPSSSSAILRPGHVIEEIEVAPTLDPDELPTNRPDNRCVGTAASGPYNYSFPTSNPVCVSTQ
jgi:hypothetical protein